MKKKKYFKNNDYDEFVRLISLQNLSRDVKNISDTYANLLVNKSIERKQILVQIPELDIEIRSGFKELSSDEIKWAIEQIKWFFQYFSKNQKEKAGFKDVIINFSIKDQDNYYTIYNEKIMNDELFQARLEYAYMILLEVVNTMNQHKARIDNISSAMSGSSQKKVKLKKGFPKNVKM